MERRRGGGRGSHERFPMLNRERVLNAPELLGPLGDGHVDLVRLVLQVRRRRPALWNWTSSSARESIKRTSGRVGERHGWRLAGSLLGALYCTTEYVLY